MAERRSTATTTRPRAPKAEKPMSATQRNTLATKKLLDHLSTNDKQAAITAALETITEQLAWDTGLRASLRQKYSELQELVRAKEEAKEQKEQAKRTPKLVPIKGPDLSHYNPYGKLNPYTLLEGFGHGQLRAVLTSATPARLREAVSIVQERAPGTKPTSQSRKADMVDYIMEYVAGPGY